MQYYDVNGKESLIHINSSFKVHSVEVLAIK